MNVNKISFFIDNQDFINAFVLPGQKIFLTTRLLIESKRIDDIAGVIGHEIGHIIGGHFTQRLKAMEQSSMINIISSILAVLVRPPENLIAISSCSSSLSS